MTTVCFQLCDKTLEGLPIYLMSGHIEVQERASSAIMLVQFIKDVLLGKNSEESHTTVTRDLVSTSITNGEINDETFDASIDYEIIKEVALLFRGELNPVALKAQRKVQIPEGYYYNVIQQFFDNRIFNLIF